MFKPSQYSFFIPYKDKVIYYNSLFKSSFLLTPAEHERMQEQFADPISFELGFPSVFKQFCEWGFFVPDTVDELDVFRYQYNDKYSKQDAHIVISVSNLSNIDGEYIPQSKRQKISENLRLGFETYCKHFIENKHLTSFCLEWIGGEPLIYLDDIILPATKQICDACKTKELPFQCQLETSGTLLSDNTITKLKGADINSFKIIMYGNEAKHNKVFHEKGLPTYHKVLKNIVNLCNCHPACHVELLVKIGVEEEIEQLKKCIPAGIRKNIHLNFDPEVDLENKLPVSANISKNLLDDSSLNSYIDDLGFAKLADGRKWINSAKPSLLHHVFDFNGFVYSAKSAMNDEKKAVGKLADDGQIEWDALNLSQMHGSPWFENELCRKCKYLPLLSDVCEHVCSKTDYRKELIPLVCILKQNTFSPDFFVVSSYKTKEKFIKNQANKNE